MFSRLVSRFTYPYCLFMLILSPNIIKYVNGSCDRITPCVPLPTANDRFAKCCAKVGLTDCVPHCKYDITTKELIPAVTKTKDCPLELIRDYLLCAADNKDNTYCCTETGVLDGSREVCEPFCNPNSDDWPTSKKGAAKYLKCLKKFNDIMTCHHASLKP